MSAHRVVDYVLKMNCMVNGIQLFGYDNFLIASFVQDSCRHIIHCYYPVENGQKYA